jgi:flagellar basal-body rod modification protein FlgD
MADAITATPGTAAPTGTTNGAAAGAGKGLSGDLQTFLLMLTTQMRNQDPLKPIESSDFAVQLATFSGVEQQVKTNQLLGSLGDQLGLSGMAQLAGWVGMEARVSAPAAFDGSPVTILPDPRDGADQAMLVILDATNREVMREPVAATDDPIVWAGTDAAGAPFPPGQSSCRIDSYKDGELLGTDMADIYATVTEVQSGIDGPLVVLEGGATVAASEVRALRHPGD